MVFFRGDDRNGLDSVFLATRQDGSFYFHVESDQAESENLIIHPPANEWVHVAATFDSARQRMDLYITGRRAASTHTTLTPVPSLDPAVPGGIGIGNHSGFPGTAYNMPLSGSVDNLRIYSRALTEREIQRLFCLEGGIPRLTLSDLGTNCLLEWPSTPAPFALENCHTSGLSAHDWQQTAQPAVLGADGYYQLTLPKDAAFRLFRLRRISR